VLPLAAKEKIMSKKFKSKTPVAAATTCSELWWKIKKASEMCFTDIISIDDPKNVDQIREAIKIHCRNLRNAVDDQIDCFERECEKILTQNAELTHPETKP
jgi:hypothetical protein